MTTKQKSARTKKVVTHEEDNAVMVPVGNETRAFRTVEAEILMTQGRGLVAIELWESDKSIYVELAGDFIHDATGMRDGQRAVRFGARDPLAVRQLGEALIAASMRAEASGMFDALLEIQAKANRSNSAAGV